MDCDVSMARPRSFTASSRVPARTQAWMETIGRVCTSRTTTVTLFGKVWTRSGTAWAWVAGMRRKARSERVGTRGDGVRMERIRVETSGTGTERESGTRNTNVSMYKSEPRRRFPAGVRCWSENPPLSPEFHDVGGLLTLLALHRLELDDLALSEGSVSFALNRRVMDEELLAGVLADESVSLGLVEPLDRASVPQYGALLSASCGRSFLGLLGADPPTRAHGLEAVTTIDRLPRGRFEGNLGRHPARRTNGFVELARRRRHRRYGRGHHAPRGGAGALALFLVPAATAASRLMLKPTFLVERLLPRREHELLPAVPTLDRLVTLHHEASRALSPWKRESPGGRVAPRA